MVIIKTMDNSKSDNYERDIYIELSNIAIQTMNEMKCLNH